MGAKLTRKNLAKHATVKLCVEQDDQCVRGNALASGNEDIDKECEDEIIRRLECGDTWAWAAVEVYAEIELETGYIRGESDYLGGCSYKDEADFRRDAYFEDMSDIALDNLWAAIKELNRKRA